MESIHKIAKWLMVGCMVMGVPMVYSQTSLFEAGFNNSLDGFDDTGRVYTSSNGVILRGGYSDGGIVSPPINASGSDNLRLSYTRVTARLSGNERFSVGVSTNGFSFTELESSNSANGRVSFSLPGSFENASSLFIRFAIDGSSFFDSLTVSDLALESDGGSCEGDECCAPDCGGGGTLPPVNSVFSDGPFSVSIQRFAGPGRGWVSYPTNLGQGGLRHPIFVWGPGAGSDQSDYEFLLRRLASHGFIVYSETSTGDGDEMQDALDWLISENNRSSSNFYQKLDTTKIAFGGHSRGSIGTFEVANDRRLTTTVHVAGGSFDGNGPDNLRNPAIYIGGTEDFATPNIENDYRNTDVPVFFTVMDGIDHIFAAREGMPAITAWLRWQLGGESFRREEDFLSRFCTFCTGIWDSESKNW